MLLACSTALNVFPHKLSETRPPEFGSDKLAGLEVSRVTSSFMVMTAGKDGTAEGTFWGNIDMTFVHEDVVIKLPIRES